MKYNRFEMEQLIMKCWDVVDDIDLLMENVVEGDLTQDNISNALLGMSEMYRMKFEKLFRMFEASCKEDFEREREKENDNSGTDIPE